MTTIKDLLNVILLCCLYFYSIILNFLLILHKFGIFNLVKTLLELIFNPYGEIR